jgi:hypothetical protein
MKRWMSLSVIVLPLVLGGQANQCGCATNCPTVSTNSASGTLIWTDKDGVRHRVTITCGTIPTSAFSRNLQGAKLNVPIPAAGTTVDVELGAANVTASVLQQVDTIYLALDDAQFRAFVDSLLPNSSADSQAYYTTMSTVLVAYSNDLAQAKTEQDVANANNKANTALQTAGPTPPAPSQPTQSAAAKPQPPAALPAAASPAAAPPTPAATQPSPALVAKLATALSAVGASPAILDQPPKSLSTISKTDLKPST